QPLEQPASAPAIPSPGEQSGLPDFARPSPPPGTGSRRGLYMALGSIVTLAVLAAAAIEGPKFLRTHASGPQKTAAQDTNPPAAQPSPTPAQSSPSPTPAPTVALSDSAISPVAETPAAPAPNQDKPTAPSTTGTEQAKNRPATSVPLRPAPQNRSAPPAVTQQPGAPVRNQRISELRQEYNSLAINVNSAKESLL